MATNEVTWSAFGMPISEPSDEELNHWRALARLWTAYSYEIERQEAQLRELREARDSLAHILDCGPRNNVLEQMAAQREAAADAQQD